MKRTILLLVFACLVAGPVLAQPPAAQPAASGAAAADPLSQALKSGFDTIGRYLVGSADKMPEADFAFKPTPEVRSFGQILGHVANTHYNYCARVKGEKNPNTQDLEKITAKAEMVKAFNDSVDYCKAVYASMTDAKIVQPMTPPAPPTAPGAAQTPAAAPRPFVPFNVLNGNLSHDWEHYGNIVTYLRLKGLVPPSTERSQAGRGRGM